MRVRSFDNKNEYASEPTDETGKFRITDIEEGWYTFGISSPEGDFNLGYGVNLKSGQTATIVVWIRLGGQLERIEPNETQKKKSFFKKPTGILGVIILTAGGAFTLLSNKESEVSPIR